MVVNDGKLACSYRRRSNFNRFRAVRGIHLGSTIVELLVTIAITTALIGLLLPALQHARESGRLMGCQNNLRQIALGLFTFHDAHDHFPHGGWGHKWVGVPERGAGRKQPGGWIYCVLPYLEEAALHNLGMGLSGADADDAYSQRLRSPLPVFVCPSRRHCDVWPIADAYAYVRTPEPFGNVSSVARADYAINAGTSHIFAFGGPADLAQGDDVSSWRNAPNPAKFSGISHLRNAASLKSVTDGTSKTYLIGEKYVLAQNYATGLSTGDNESLYAGYCSDLHRFAGVIENLKLERPPFLDPLNDRVDPGPAISGDVRFGSAHSSGCNMVFCDGSVQLVDYDVSPDLHFRSGHRSDNGVPLAHLN